METNQTPKICFWKEWLYNALPPRRHPPRDTFYIFIFFIYIFYILLFLFIYFCIASGSGDEPDAKNLLLERVTIQRPPTPQTSTTGQLFAFTGQTRNVEKKSIGSPSTGNISYPSLFNNIILYIFFLIWISLQQRARAFFKKKKKKILKGKATICDPNAARVPSLLAYLFFYLLLSLNLRLASAFSILRFRFIFFLKKNYSPFFFHS